MIVADCVGVGLRSTAGALRRGLEIAEKFQAL
jgi:hypothetical protein